MTAGPLENAPAPPLQDRVAALADTLDAIGTMELDALRTLWTRHFGTPPPLRSTELMRLVLGWRLQARTWGGIDAKMRRQLKPKGSIEADGLNLQAGTILTREWQGITYEITVTDDGFRWEGETYPSLSAVATAITGTRWNGPRFFGLRDGKA